MGYLSISLYHFHIPSLMFYSFQSLYLLLPYLSLFLCETFSYCSFRVHYLKHSVCLSPVALVGMLDFMRMQVASWASLMAQIVKNLPAMQETWVQSLGCEEALEKGKATDSSILAWRIHGLYSRKESDMIIHFNISSCIFLQGVLSAVTLIGGGESRARARCEPELHLCSVSVITLSRAVSGPKLL